MPLKGSTLFPKKKPRKVDNQIIFIVFTSSQDIWPGPASLCFIAKINLQFSMEKKWESRKNEI